MKLIVSAEAIADLERLRLFIAEKDVRAAQRAVATLADAISSLKVLPERGRVAAVPGLRELVVPFGRSAYVVRYAYRAPGKSVLVVRIWHGRESRS